ncbi:MAG: sugar MFS transporter [Anaerolineaceae bacterium]
MSSTFSRNQVTWLMYLMLAFFGYLLNILGPITPFLMDEFKLSYTISSMHFTAFATGMILVGLGGHIVVHRIGRWKTLWISAFGMSLGSIFLITGQTPAITILSCFLMGTVGSFIPVLVSSILSDQYGVLRTVALFEANFYASTSAAVAPLLVGWFAKISGLPLAGWRMALVFVVIVPILMRFMVGKIQLPNEPVQSGTMKRNRPSETRSLPARYWLFWAAIVLAVSVEFCMIFWSADYLEKILGLAKADAALFVSLFLGGMILGRLLGSRLIQGSSEKWGILISLSITSVGFLFFWCVTLPVVSIAGLFLTGLGIANLYPFFLSLALCTAGSQAVQASTRASLASGVAILCLPLILGRLADSLGIRMAYAVIIVLLLGLFFITTTAQLPKTNE